MAETLELGVVGIMLDLDGLLSDSDNVARIDQIVGAIFYGISDPEKSLKNLWPLNSP